jgi:hypothetical protein
MEMRVHPAPAERVGPGDLRVRERADQSEAALVEQGDPTGAGDQIVRERRVAHPPAEKVAATRGVSAIRS